MYTYARTWLGCILDSGCGAVGWNDAGLVQRIVDVGFRGFESGALILSWFWMDHDRPKWIILIPYRFPMPQHPFTKYINQSIIFWDRNDNIREPIRVLQTSWQMWCVFVCMPFSCSLTLASGLLRTRLCGYASHVWRGHTVKLSRKKADGTTAFRSCSKRKTQKKKRRRRTDTEKKQCGACEGKVETVRHCSQLHLLTWSDKTSLHKRHLHCLVHGGSEP